MLDDYEGTILLVTHDRYLVDAIATQIWEIDTDESHLIIFKGIYSQLKEEREKDLARRATVQAERESAVVADKKKMRQKPSHRPQKKIKRRTQKSRNLKARSPNSKRS
ncbi:MAG: hypothetical protein IPL71_23440 [Anaerolineales bacterium]|uniref:hypothetical protein n=1 Tax=Candidatus Villigracilis proximus TaxID=3140683 RepID=UPI00313655E3|nr:hypothetical protein [Anaerolineales bacterium]